MRLVDDYQVEATYGERLLVRIDKVDHGLIRRERDTGIHISLASFVQHASRFIRKQLHEILMRLLHKRSSVGQEKYVLHPVVALQYIHQRDGHTRLSRTRSHHQQCFPALGIVMLANRLDGHFLIIAVGDVVLYREVRNVLSAPLLNHAFQVVLGMETIESARRIAQSVYHKSLESVGIVNHRTHPVLLFQAIGIQLCLMLALGRRYRSPLGFDYRQWLAVATEQHIVGIAHFVSVRHALQFHFHARLRWLYQSVCVKNFPPCFA